MILHFLHTRVWGCKFHLAIERSKVNLESVPNAVYQDSALKLSRFWRRRFFRRFLPYMGIVDILFKDAELFEQIDNTPSTESPM